MPGFFNLGKSPKGDGQKPKHVHLIIFRQTPRVANVQYYNKNQWVVYPCLEIQVNCLCVGIFHESEWWTGSCFYACYVCFDDINVQCIILKILLRKQKYYNWAMRAVATSVCIIPSWCAHSNAMTCYDFTMDIPSNIIAYCDVIIGHGTKKVVSTTWFTQKIVIGTESPPVLSP